MSGTLDTQQTQVQKPSGTQGLVQEREGTAQDSGYAVPLLGGPALPGTAGEPPPHPTARSLSRAALRGIQRNLGNVAAQRAIKHQRVTVQRYFETTDEGGILSVVFRGTSLFYELELEAPARAVITDRVTRQQIERALEAALNPADGPVHETHAFLQSPAILGPLAQDIGDWSTVGRLTRVEGLLQARATALTGQRLLYDLEQWLETNSGQSTSVLDWRRELPLLLAEAQPPPVTVIEASDRDRYSMFLRMLQNEAAALAPRPGATPQQTPQLRAALQRYLFTVLTPSSFSGNAARVHSERFIAEWLAELDGIQIVPAGFNLDPFRPTGEEMADSRRQDLVRTFVDQQAAGLATMYALDRWTLSNQHPEVWLRQLDLSTYREGLLDHLAGVFIENARRDGSYNELLRNAAVERARFQMLSLITLRGAALQRQNHELASTLATTQIDELGQFEREVAADPGSYIEMVRGLATATTSLLTQVRPGQQMELQFVEWAAQSLSAMELPPAFAGAVLWLELGQAVRNLRDLVADQERRAREQIAGLIDTRFADIAATVRAHAEFAATFIENQWIPTLKQVALERVQANRDQLQNAYDRWDTESASVAARFNIAAHTLDDMASGLREGRYQSIRIDGQTITVADVEQLETAAQFMRDEAAVRTDPERSRERREKIAEAIEGYDQVRADIESGEYDPLDYSRSVYDEARQHLGIGAFPEGTTVGMVLLGGVPADRNPFLARAIVEWRWREGSERTITQFLIFTAAGLLTVASLIATMGASSGIVAGPVAAILTVADIAVGAALGVQAVFDAYEVLRMARLDTNQSIRGVTVEQAEAALNHAWIGLAVTVLLTIGVGALFGMARLVGRSGGTIPAELRLLNELASSNPVLAERIIARVGNLQKAEELLSIAGDATLLDRMLLKAETAAQVEYLLLFGDASRLAGMVERCDSVVQLTRMLERGADIEQIAVLLDRVDNAAQLDRMLIKAANAGEISRLLDFGSAARIDTLLTRCDNAAQLTRMLQKGADVEQIAVLLDRVENASQLDRMLAKAANASELSALLDRVPAAQLDTLLARCDTAAQLDGILLRTTGPEQVMTLLGRVDNARQLLWMLEIAGDGRQLATLLDKADTAAQLETLLHNANNVAELDRFLTVARGNGMGGTNVLTLYEVVGNRQLLTLPTQPDSEIVAAMRAAELERADAGHSLHRHGPGLNDPQLELRVTTGYAPDGGFSPTPASTRFFSYEEWMTTRQAALDGISTHYGVDLTQPHQPGTPLRYRLTVEHRRPIGEGLVGRTGTEATVPHPVSGNPRNVHTATDPVSGLSRTTTSIEWNPTANRWDVKQHFPYGLNWDQATQSYTNAAQYTVP